MIFYYSATEKSKLYAEILAKILDRKTYKLESALDGVTGKTFFIKGVWKAVTNAEVPILNMPPADSFSDDNVYLCSPIWGGKPAPPIKYFLRNAPLANKTVNMICVSGSGFSSHKENTEKFLQTVNCTVGNVQIFAANYATTDTEIIEEHIRELMF
ncbi:MAG: hypothetical protein FWG68_04665 [Defluviitaleaceae bacterium]|nr:hypothetical protein [Defluviitaleaceae bacterium]